MSANLATAALVSAVGWYSAEHITSGERWLASGEWREAPQQAARWLTSARLSDWLDQAGIVPVAAPPATINRPALRPPAALAESRDDYLREGPYVATANLAAPPITASAVAAHSDEPLISRPFSPDAAPDGVTAAEPSATATVATAQPTAAQEVYVVASGDTLSSIADRFNTSASAIARLNKLDNPNRLVTGDRLSIPR